MKKVFLQAALCFNLLSGIQASSDVETKSDTHEYSQALRNLHSAVRSGPSAIEHMTESGELRGATFSGFDETLYKFFQNKEFKEGEPYDLLDYACGTGRWSATAALQSEMDKLKVAYTAYDPYIQPEHAEYYNQAWSTYVTENGSSIGSFAIGRGWLSEIALENPIYNAILVRDSIHLFSDAHVAELFQIGFQITHQSGSIIVQATPPFATMFWHPKVRVFLQSNNLALPRFEEIFFCEGSFKAYGDFVACKNPGVLGRLNQKRVCLPAIRNAAEQNGWWLQAIQVGTTLMTHTKPLTEKQLFEFIRTKIKQLTPKPEEYGLDYKPQDPNIFLRFKKNAPQPAAEAK